MAAATVDLSQKFRNADAKNQLQQKTYSYHLYLSLESCVTQLMTFYDGKRAVVEKELTEKGFLKGKTYQKREQT